jgi:AraC family transcriptional regulator
VNNEREIVSRVQSYIESHINDKLTLRELAEYAGYSQWHLSRMFNEVIGKSPFEYIRSRRLSEAAIKLRDGNENVIDVALDFAFDSHEGFTRAFSREFGITPWKYKKENPALALYLFSEVCGAYKTISLKKRKGGTSKMTEKTRTIFVQVIERPERKCLVKWGKTANHYLKYCEEVGCDVWDTLCKIKEALYEPAGMWFPEKLRPEGTSEYVHGVELPLDYAGEIPDGFDLITLPACTMMIFQGEPFENDDDFAEAVEEVWQHIDNFNPKSLRL